MLSIGLVVPVLSNFTGFAQLMNSVDAPIKPIILDNWNGNRGVAASWNQGIARGIECARLIICNDDVAFYPGTIAKLINMETMPYDLVSVVSTDTGQKGFLEDEKPDFCCFAIQPERFVESFGWFDENFKPAYFEDNDMYYRMKLAGAKTALRLDARVDHGGSVTQLKGKGHDTDDRVVSHHQFRLNRDYYTAKWGGEPGQEKYKTPFDRGGSIKDW